MTSVSQQLVTYCNNNYECVATTKYLTFFQTRVGKRFAVENELKGDARIWLEYGKLIFDNIDGVEVSNKKFPGKPYDEFQTRNSNLNAKNSPTLKFGNEVWRFSIRELPAFTKLMEQY